MDVFEIEWKGPYLPERVDQSYYSDEWGIYMVTRKWGDNEEKILYIGQTYDRSFIKRLEEHKWWVEALKGQPKVRLGLVDVLTGEVMTRKRVNDVEAFLIYNMQPKYNTKHKRTYSGRELTVMNNERRGPLPDLMSTE